MNLDLSGEQVALRDTVRRALAAEAPPDRAWERLAGLGALDVLVPVSRGGSGSRSAKTLGSKRSRRTTLPAQKVISEPSATSRLRSFSRQ